ncbi:MAG: acyl carrier protein [Xenococcaceae cyanobacterium]
MVVSCTICSAASDSGTDLCPACSGLLRWVRGYFAHEPGLPEKITPEVRFIEDLGVDSLDWVCWPLEAEEKLGVTFPDDQVLEKVQTVGDWIRLLRQMGAEWPTNREVHLLPRLWWWSSYRWVVTESEPET